MTKSMMPRTTRRHLLAGGAAALLTSVGALRQASAEASAASGPDYAVFTEFSPESKLLKGGWNTRVFTNTNSRNGKAIQCDFATGIVTVAPGTYHISGMSIVNYNSGGEPPEMATVRAPASAGYCRLRLVGSNSGQPRQHQKRRSQCQMHRQRGHRQYDPEPVRNLFNDDRPADENASGASSGKQSPTGLPARLHPEFEVARDGQDRHPPGLGTRDLRPLRQRDRDFQIANTGREDRHDAFTTERRALPS